MLLFKRLIALVLLVTAFVAVAEAQRGKPLPKDPKVFKSRYARKLKQGFVKQTPWLRDLKEAQKISRKKELPIVAYFTRSFSY